MSKLNRGQFNDYPTERLLGFPARLGNDWEIKIVTRKNSTQSGHIHGIEACAS